MLYAELHAKTNFSFLEGASHPDELVRRAAELGYAALAITDRDSLAGVVRAHVAAKEVGLKLVIGAEITPEDAPPVVLWATDRPSYGRLSSLITRGRRRAWEKHATGRSYCGWSAVSDFMRNQIIAVRGIIGHRCATTRQNPTRWGNDTAYHLLMETRIMKTSRTVLAIGVVVAALASSYAGSAETNTPPVRSSIPYVATRNDAVRDMLWMASVGEDDVVYDLGSGDGRIVIAAVRDFGARRAVGIEMDPERVRKSRENAQKAGVTERVEFIEGDLFTTDLREASVVTMFLGHEPNIRLRPKMLSILKPGTRIVSHQFGMGEWLPDKTLTARTVYLGMWGEMGNRFGDNPHVPDYNANEMHHGTTDKMLMWVVPAPVAGIWRGKIETARGPQNLQLILHQRLAKVTGTFELSGQTHLTGGVEVDLWGDHVRYGCRADNTYGRFQLRFDGHVRGNTMQGTLSVAENGRLEERAWEAQRDKEADFTGTWEWPCATGPRSVGLRIEQRDGQLTATYLDRDQEVRVTDLYDFGGGLYFTLLIGREGDTVKGTEDTGWLIGEGVLDHGALKGTIEFYPWGDMPDVLNGGKTPEPVIQNWKPRLIKS